MTHLTKLQEKPILKRNQDVDIEDNE